jgi:TolB protein
MKNLSSHPIQIILSMLVAAACVNFAAGQEQNKLTMTEQLGALGLTKPIPVSLEGFSGEVESVLKFDLYVQGFSFVTPDAAQYQISGSNAGNVIGGVTDKIAKRALLPPRSYSGASLRRQAHAFADDVVLTITGRKGIAQTKIAFKAQQPDGAGEIYVSDFDGGNPQAATRDNVIVSKPSWVPGRLALYYNSYKLENPDIFYADLSTRERRVIARYGGSSFSPAASPDGTRVAMILSKEGSPNVFVANADGSNLKRLTTGIEDSSPCWSPDGQWICFATKIQSAGIIRRVLAKVPASGGTVQVIRTSGAPNPTEPDWSPDGKWIAFTSQTSEFDICVMPADGSAAPTVLAVGASPSWSPNSRTLIYNRSVNYRQTLSVLDVFTKQHKDIGRISGSDSEPAWRKELNF